MWRYWLVRSATSLMTDLRPAYCYDAGAGSRRAESLAGRQVGPQSTMTRDESASRTVPAADAGHGWVPALPAPRAIRHLRTGLSS